MNNSTPYFSIISPVYKAEQIVSKLVESIQSIMKEIDVPYEIILVDDRSPDNSWSVIKKLSNNYPEVKSVRLSKNFGQHPAIMAGLSLAKGEWTVVMDCDLQDQPKEIIKLYNKTKEGYDLVLARRENRKDSYLKKLSSKLFSKAYGFFTDSSFDNQIANFGIYNRKVVDSTLSIQDYIKVFPLFVQWVGFNAANVTVEHSKRDSGKSSYNLKKLLHLAINSLVSFSDKPLRLVVKFGLLISFGSFMSGIYLVYRYLEGKIEVAGYSSIIVSIWFLSGVIITTIGITGIYVGKIFDQSKKRPVFVIDEIV